MIRRRLPPIMIDARATGEDGRPLALAPVQGRAVLRHLVEMVGAGSGVRVHGAPEWQRDLREAIGDAGVEWDVVEPASPAAVLRCDRLYDGPRLRRVLRRAGDPEEAVLWRLDTPGGLEAADAELLRRRTFQPLGRFWALRPAKALARRLAPTVVRPNAVTILAGGLMLAASVLLAFASPNLGARLAAASCLAVALVLDTADGHLARLQGRASAMGRWLDATLDETADMALHAAVAWAAYVASSEVGWLLAGMAYGMGKYVFVASNTIWQESPTESKETGAGGPDGRSAVRRLAHLAGHADVRWHGWIVLAAAGWMRFELVGFAAYYLIRAMAGGVRKARGLSHA